MRIIKFGNICLLVSLAALTGCLEREFVEEEGIMSVDTKELVVPADMYEGRNLVTDTVFVTSNRSWSAAFETDVDWVKMDTTGHQDMARISEVTPLVFRFKDNDSEDERTVKVKIFCADGDKEITLRQESIKYRLVLTSSTDGFGSIKSDGDTVKVIFNSNAPGLSISSKSGSTAKMSYAATSDSGKSFEYIYKVSVAENEELVTKEGTIIVSSPKIPEEKWIEIPVGQLEGYPYFRFTGEFENPDAPEVKAVDGVSGIIFGIKTNTSWKAELVSSDGFKDIEKYDFDSAAQKWNKSADGFAAPGDVVAAGVKTDATASIGFPATIAFGSNPKIVVKFIAEGVSEPKTVTITQKPCVRWWMGILDNDHMWKNDASLGYAASDGSTWGLIYPPVSGTGALPTSSGSRINVGKEMTFITKSGISFRVYTPYGMWRNSKSGIMIGRGENATWFEIPAIEGVALKSVWLTNRAATATFAFEIQTFDGTKTILADCSFAGQGNQKEFVVTGTTPNTAYRIISKNGSDFQIGDVIYYYE